LPMGSNPIPSASFTHNIGAKAKSGVSDLSK